MWECKGSMIDLLLICSDTLARGNSRPLCPLQNKSSLFTRLWVWSAACFSCPQDHCEAPKSGMGCCVSNSK